MGVNEKDVSMDSTKRPFRRIAALAAATTLTLVIAGCAGGGGSASSGSQTPIAGGDITVMSAGGIGSWDPALAFFGTLPGVATDRLVAVYGQLVYVDQSGELVPSLAEGLVSEDGGATWTLTLREGITFTDGTPFDAEAVKFNWDRIADPATAAPTAALAQSFTTTVVDDLTLAIAPQAANPVLDEQIAELMQFIASPTALAAGEYTEPVGAGPFLLTKQDPAVGEDFEPNPDYILGPPVYAGLHYRTVGDPSQRVETIAAGTADLMNGFSSDFRDYADDPRFEMFTVENGGFRHLVFNNARAPFDDVRARKAVALALDPAELTQTLLADPEQTGSTTLFSPESPYYDASLALPAQDLDAAQELVDELIADGVDMSFTIVAAAIPESIRAAEYVQLSLQQLDGVTVDIEQVQIQDWRMRTQGNDDFDITFYLGIYDVNPVASAFTNLFEEGGTENIQNSASPAMDAALEDLQTATSPEETAAALESVQQTYLDEVPVYAFGFDHRIFFHNAQVQGFDAFGRGSILAEDLFRTE